MNNQGFCKYNLEDFTEDDLVDLCKQHIPNNAKALDRVIDEMKLEDDDVWKPIVLNFLKIMHDDMRLGELLRAHPKIMLQLFERALDKIQDSILAQPVSGRLHKKKKLRVRIDALPQSSETMKGTLPRTSDINKLVAVRGTVIRTGAPKMLEYKRVFECVRCHQQFEEEADLENWTPFPKPTSCPNPITPPCNSHNFKVIDMNNEADCRDYQEIKIQEQVHQLGVGSLPRSIIVILMEDLVDSCKAGDDVTITGVVTRRWKPFAEDERCDLEMILLANFMRVNNEQKFGLGVTEELKNEFELFWQTHSDAPLRGRNVILQSIAPEVYGMHSVKLAVAMVLAGGVQRIEANGSKIRGESHLLMVGDPGTGKSQVLKAAARIANRAVLTTGIGTTGAGLTVTAVKDKGGEWTLEAGALVLADGGVCCIDEFNSIQEHDKTTIHEAMEQQTLHIAKAGLVCTLQTRCSVIAATNPKGKFDPSQTISVNVAIGGPLLSRFDIVMLLLDQNDEGWDKTVSSFILSGRHREGADKAEWTCEKLQAYISFIRTTFRPQLTPESKRVLSAYYQKQRASDVKDSARTTVRMLESLIRLAQAHAKLMMRPKVSQQDAIMAVIMMEASMYTSALDGVSSAVRTMFPANPDDEYLKTEARVLRNLGLPVNPAEFAPSPGLTPNPPIEDNYPYEDPPLIRALDDDVAAPRHSMLSETRAKFLQVQPDLSQEIGIITKKKSNVVADDKTHFPVPANHPSNTLGDVHDSSWHSSQHSMQSNQQRGDFAGCARQADIAASPFEDSPLPSQRGAKSPRKPSNNITIPATPLSGQPIRSINYSQYGSSAAPSQAAAPIPAAPTQPKDEPQDNIDNLFDFGITTPEIPHIAPNASMSLMRGEDATIPAAPGQRADASEPPPARIGSAGRTPFHRAVSTPQTDYSQQIRPAQQTQTGRSWATQNRTYIPTFSSTVGVTTPQRGNQRDGAKKSGSFITSSADDTELADEQAPAAQTDVSNVNKPQESSLDIDWGIEDDGNAIDFV